MRGLLVSSLKALLNGCYELCLNEPRYKLNYVLNGKGKNVRILVVRYGGAICLPLSKQGKCEKTLILKYIFYKINSWILFKIVQQSQFRL